MVEDIGEEVERRPRENLGRGEDEAGTES